MDNGTVPVGRRTRPDSVEGTLRDGLEGWVGDTEPVPWSTSRDQGDT
jgi:hypothetical protein